MQKKTTEIEYKRKIKEIEFFKNPIDIQTIQRNKITIGMEVKKIISRFGLWDEQLGCFWVDREIVED